MQRIHIIGTQLNYLPNDVFVNLPTLHTVDLRNNALIKIDPHSFNANVIYRIYLAGNPWKCNENITWIADINDTSLANKIEDRDKLLCSIPYEGRPLITVMNIITVMCNKNNLKKYENKYSP